jgi:hypothetical protein
MSSSETTETIGAAAPQGPDSPPSTAEVPAEVPVEVQAQAGAAGESAPAAAAEAAAASGAEGKPEGDAKPAEAEAGPSDGEAKPAGPAAAPAAAPAEPPPLKAPDGSELRVSFSVDPVLDLKVMAPAGHRIESRIMRTATGVELTAPERRNLMPRDFEQIDLLALERGVSRLTAGDIPNKPTLILQLSFATLGNGRARISLLERARQMQQILRQAVICELVDVEPGVPTGRLEEVTLLLRGFFRAVWVEVEANRQILESAAQAKASGLTIRASSLGDDGPSIVRGLRAFIGMVKKPALVIATGLPSTDLMLDAVKMGFTHATLRANAESLSPAVPPAVKAAGGLSAAVEAAAAEAAAAAE